MEDDNIDFQECLYHLCDNLGVNIDLFSEKYSELDQGTQNILQDFIVNFYDDNTEYETLIENNEIEIGEHKEIKENLLHEQAELRNGGNMSEADRSKYVANTPIIQQTNVAIQNLQADINKTRKKQQAFHQEANAFLNSKGIATKVMQLGSGVTDNGSDNTPTNTDDGGEDDSNERTVYSKYEPGQNNEMQKCVTRIAGKGDHHTFYKFVDRNYHGLAFGDDTSPAKKAALLKGIQEIIRDDPTGDKARALIDAYNAPNDKQKIAHWLRDNKVMHRNSINRYLEEYMLDGYEYN